MSVPPILPAPLFLPEDPPAPAPEEVLVAGTTPLPAEDTPVAIARPLAEQPPAPAALLPPPVALDPDPTTAPATAAMPVDDAPAAPEPAPTPADPPPAQEPAPSTTQQPAFTQPEDASFPTLAELDAILAAHAGPPAGPDAAERATAAALLGLDPAIAEDPALYDATIAALPEPDADAVLAAWIDEAGASLPPPQPAGPAGDWQLG